LPWAAMAFSAGTASASKLTRILFTVMPSSAAWGIPLPSIEGSTSASVTDALSAPVRPSVIFGAQDKFLNVFAQLQRMFPLIPLAGADTRFQPVWVEDVAAAVMRCLQDDATIGQTFEACGPEVFTLRDLVRLAGQYAGVNQGRGRAVFALPMPLARVQAWVMERLPGEPLMSGDNLDSMALDNIASGKVPGLDALGITPAALAAIAPGYLRKR